MLFASIILNYRQTITVLSLNKVRKANTQVNFTNDSLNWSIFLSFHLIDDKLL